jgi:hypothetical protein
MFRKNSIDSVGFRKNLKSINKEEILKNLRTKEKRTMHFNLLNITLTMTCRSLIPEKHKKLMKAYDHIVNYILDKLDVKNYIELMKKLELLKALILTKEQGLFFDFIKKTNILDTEELKAINMDVVKDKAEDAISLINYFNTKINNMSLTPRDIEIYLLVKDFLKDYIGKNDEDGENGDSSRTLKKPRYFSKRSILDNK